MQVSIIIPIYNAEKTLERCIESIVRQNGGDWEIIAIDDGSEDASVDILKKYEEELGDKFRWFTQENQGVSKTREKGVRLARGQYVMFVDNDDFLDQDYVETFTKEMEEGDYDCVVGGYRRVNEKNQVFYRNAPTTEWLKLAMIMPWARILKKDYIVKNNIRFLDYPLGEDIYFNMWIYHQSSHVKRIDYIGYNWYLNSKSVSRTTHRGLKESCDAVYMLDKVDEVIGHSRELKYQYWFVKWIVWYLGYSGKDAAKEEFIDESEKLFGWLKKKQIKCYFPVYSKVIEGEPLKNRLIIILFLLIKKMNLLKVFAFLYCRG